MLGGCHHLEVHHHMFQQQLDPVFGSLLISALVAAIPIVLLFVLLGVFRVKAPFAALAALALSITLAIVGWQMPPVQALSATAAGVFYGLFPILWILINALWVYKLTVATTWSEAFGRTIRSVSNDLRILSILIAFCFGALLESLAGFGAPVAISAAMLMAAGMVPFKAAIVSLLANTAPVAFGALAAPIFALAGVTGLPLRDLASMAGRDPEAAPVDYRDGHHGSRPLVRHEPLRPDRDPRHGARVGRRVLRGALSSHRMARRRDHRI